MFHGTFKINIKHLNENVTFGLNTCNIFVKYMQHLDLLLQHPHEALAIFFWNILNPWSICLQQMHQNRPRHERCSELLHWPAWEKLQGAAARRQQTPPLGAGSSDPGSYASSSRAPRRSSAHARASRASYAYARPSLEEELRPCPRPAEPWGGGRRVG